MAALYRIRLLGALEFALPGRTWKPKKYNKLRDYLALHTRLHEREALIDCLWPDKDLEAGRNGLSVMMTDLRRQLEPPGVPPGTLLVTRGQMVGLNAEQVTTDVAEFEAALEQARAAAAKRNPGRERKCLEAAVALYGGELLTGCYEKTNKKTEDPWKWVWPVRDDLARHYRVALRRLAALCEASGEDEKAAFHGQAVAFGNGSKGRGAWDGAAFPDEDAARAETHALLLRCAWRQGGEPALRAQLAQAERSLDDEDEDFLPALRRLAKTLRDGGAPPWWEPSRAPVPFPFGDLPTDLSAFIVGLCIFPGDFAPEAAASVCEEPNAVRLLRALEQRGLVNAVGGGRFRLSDAARDASDRTLDKDKSERHAEWCVRFAEQAEPHLGKTLQGEWVERVEAERENLCAAMGWCLQSASEAGDIVLGARILKAIGPWGLRHVPAETWDGWLRAALERAPDLPHDVRLVLHDVRLVLTGEAVRCARGQGNHPLARLWLEHLRNFATKNAAAGNTAAGDAKVHDQRQLELVFTSLHEQANTAFLRENLAECLDLHQQSLTVLAARDGDMRVGRAVALADMADALLPAGQVAEAERCCEESLALHRELGLPVHVAGALWRLGQLRRTFGQFAQAHRVFDECLALRQKHGSPNCIADCSREIGLLLADEGRRALARTLLEDALARYEQQDKPPAAAATRGFLGDVAFAEGDLARARPLYESALAFWQADEHKRWIAAFLWRLGSVACHESDHETAHYLAREALTLYDASPSPLGRASTLHLLGTIALKENRFAEAEAHHRESLRLRTEMGNKPGVCASWESLAHVWANQREPHDKERAVRLFAAADAHRARLGAPLAPVLRNEHDHTINQLRHDLGNVTFDAAWSHGHRLTWKKACSLATSK